MAGIVRQEVAVTDKDASLKICLLNWAVLGPNEHQKLSAKTKA